MRLLDGKVPYMMAIGNHDYDQNNPAGRTASTKNFNSFFGPARYAGAAWYKGSFPAGSNENFYGVVTVNGRNYLIIVLEFAARDSALAWADGILKANQDKDAIIVTHMFTYMDNTRISGCDLNSAGSFGVGQDNNGEDMWWKLVRKYPNIHLVLSGHVVQGDGTGRRMDLGLNGNLVNQILSDYQSDPLGGGGYLRIMRISPSLNRVSVTSYSPYLDSFMTDDHNQFTVPYHNPGVSTAAGTISGKAKSAIDCSAAAGVTVAYSGGSAVTDANGNFTIPASARKSLAITAGKPGWLSDARTGTSTHECRGGAKPDQDIYFHCGPDQRTRAEQRWSAGRGRHFDVYRRQAALEQNRHRRWRRSIQLKLDFRWKLYGHGGSSGLCQREHQRDREYGSDYCVECDTPVRLDAFRSHQNSSRQTVICFCGERL